MPSRAVEVVRIRKALGALARLDGFPEEDAAAIEVAVGEAMANAVHHGSPHGEGDTVQVTYERAADAHIEIGIKDCGPGFDMQHWLEEVDLLALSEGERGVYLIQALMDEVWYERSLEGGRLVMRKRLPAVLTQYRPAARRNDRRLAHLTGDVIPRQRGAGCEPSREQAVA